MQEQNKTKKKKDTFLRIILIQAVFCTALLLIAAFTHRFKIDDFNALKSTYESLMSEKIESLEIFKRVKNIKDYLTETNGKGDYKSAYTVSFSPYVTTFKAVNPVEGRISSPFGRREDPFTGEPSIHSGLDIACPKGSIIKAVENGRVNQVGEDDVAGKYISITHSKNFETFYCHCSEIIAPKGAVIRKGETIALVGSTGLSTGPHLHFEVRIGSNKHDPQRLITAI